MCFSVLKIRLIDGRVGVVNCGIINKCGLEMRQWKINMVNGGICIMSVMLISLRVIAASEGRPNFLIILTDDQDVVLNGMVKIIHKM